MRFKSIASALALGLAFTATAHAERLTEEPLVDASWVESHLGNESLVVLDIRDDSQDTQFYAAGHIPSAVHAPYGAGGWRATVGETPGMLPPVEQISQTIANYGVDDDEHVVIVAHGTNSSDFGSAARVYWTFKVLGHDAVSILDGGYRAWTDANGELTTDAVSPEAGTFTAEFRPELLATEEDVKQAVNDGTNLVDGRPAAQYSGEQQSGVTRVAGTLPGAVNIENSSLYDDASASFVSPERVAELSKGVGIESDEETIAFCNTGHWASVVWFGLSEVEGKENVKMYDGSMAEWTADPENPVE